MGFFAVACQHFWRALNKSWELRRRQRVCHVTFISVVCNIHCCLCHVCNIKTVLQGLCHQQNLKVTANHVLTFLMITLFLRALHVHNECHLKCSAAWHTNWGITRGLRFSCQPTCRLGSMSCKHKPLFFHRSCLPWLAWWRCHLHTAHTFDPSAIVLCLVFMSLALLGASTAGETERAACLQLGCFALHADWNCISSLQAGAMAVCVHCVLLVSVREHDQHLRSVPVRRYCTVVYVFACRVIAALC